MVRKGSLRDPFHEGLGFRVFAYGVNIAKSCDRFLANPFDMLNRIESLYSFSPIALTRWLVQVKTHKPLERD